MSVVMLTFSQGGDMEDRTLQWKLVVMWYDFLVLDTMEGKMDDAWPASNASLCPVPSSAPWGPRPKTPDRRMDG